MAEIKGKFVTLAHGFLSTRPAIQSNAAARVRSMTGSDPKELDPEGWYDTKVLDAVFQEVYSAEDKLGAWVALKVIGQEVYSTIKYTVGLPDHLKTPLDFVKFEADGFLANHRGSDVRPRNIVKAEDRHVVIEAPAPGYDCVWIEGVYEGILRMNAIYGGKVKQTKCVKKGDSICEYDIQW